MASAFLQRGGAWVVAQSVFLSAVVVLGAVFHGDWMNTPIIVSGALLFALGGGVGVAGVLVLDRNRTPFPKPRAGSRLIQTGIYSRVRHPLYTSVMLASLGWALIWQSGPSFTVALAQIPFFIAKAKGEERWLREEFPEYAAYEKRVPRFFPRLK